MTTANPTTLLMLGDSLVEWGDWEVLLPELQVINSGIAGEHTEELSARLANEIDTVLADRPEPEYILIMTGTNNLLMGNSYFPAILGSMLPRLIDLCPGSMITLNSIMPMQIQGLPQESIQATNDELRNVAEQSKCWFLDITTPFTEQCLPVTKPCFLNDGVHLATRGYQVWAKAIQGHLAALQQDMQETT
ncbi:GDSL-type esterase/lipase family protein [Candidatus Electrothrix sp.]|uniref:GDSL-type esterase/lipase family protein n=1 Tax=Candidatus Electrothrix sp. TaxID=2170559 RepID=UPI004056143C